MIRTNNFIAIDRDVSIERNTPMSYDDRNGIQCYNPTYDWDCYLNYVRLINERRDKWVNTGLVDLGMMPVLYAPSFMNDAIVDEMYRVVNNSGLKIFSTSAVPLLELSTRSQVRDLWAFKEDVARITGIPEKKVSLESFIRWCISK